MITGILALLGSPIIGTITGFFGSWLTKREDRKLLELRNNFAIKFSQLSHEQRVAFAEVQGANDIQKIDAESFKAAVKSSGRMSGNRILDGFKSLIRPVITIYLLVGLTIITMEIHQLIGGLEVLPVEELTAIYVRIISECLYFTSVAISFWLGIRPSQRRIL